MGRGLTRFFVIFSLLAGMGLIASADLPVSSPTSAQDSTSTRPEVHYFALGDSVASGHGLDDDGSPCKRSNRAYPHEVLAELEERYTVSTFQHCACSGATVGKPNAQSLQADRYRWFTNQVTEVETWLNQNATDQPVLVSVTIGANDLGWLSFEIFEHIVENRDQFEEWALETADVAASGVAEQINRLLRFSNVRIVVTQYHNPVNKESIFFTMIPDGFGGSCHLLYAIPSLDSLTCYKKTEFAIHALNTALDRTAVDPHPPRVMLTSDLHEDFHSEGGHEAAGLAGALNLQLPGHCGLAPPAPIKHGCSGIASTPTTRAHKRSPMRSSKLRFRFFQKWTINLRS
jgi:hypothetical protein